MKRVKRYDWLGHPHVKTVKKRVPLKKAKKKGKRKKRRARKKEFWEEPLIKWQIK